MEFVSALDLLSHRSQTKGIRYDLSALLSCLDELGNPHLRLGRVIHIAGTNGKGSTLTFLAAALQAAGFSVGTFTSPHFLSYTERIQINQSPISEKELSKYISLLSTLEQFDYLTEFELLTLVSFLYFSEKKHDFIIYEVGLGGRLDATNVIHPELSIITKIGLDHTGILGQTLSDIATEKAGIIKSKVPILTLSTQPKEAFKVIEAKAEKEQAPFFHTPPLTQLPEGFLMNAGYQKDNLALALYALNLLPGISFETAYTGMKDAQIWGRLMRTNWKGKTLIIDAAHNPDGVDALLHELDGHKNCLFIAGIYGPKDAKTMIGKLVSFCLQTNSTLALCDFWKGNSWTTDQVRTLYPDFPFLSYKPEDIPTLPDHNGPVILTGSIYFISLFKPYLEA